MTIYVDDAGIPAIAQGAVPITAEDLGAITRRKRMAHRGIPDIKVIAERLATEEGTFALSFHKGQWSVAIEWGQGAEDSPMVAAAAYGLGTTAREAIEAAVREAGWS